MRPIVIAHHLVWTGYGQWLPTDPRGSMSEVLRNEYLRDTGEMLYGRKRVQPKSYEIREYFRQTESKLQFPRRAFSKLEIDCIASVRSRRRDVPIYRLCVCEAASG